MSKNCINCVENPRTGSDLLCDQCRREDYKHRQMAVGGYVLFWDNLPFGWTRDLSRVHENRPGVIAVGTKDQFVAVGGDEQNGALAWKPAVTLRCPDCGKDMVQERADEDPPNCAIVKMTCDDCHADGERHLIDYFDFNGRQITCDGALVG